MLVEYDAALRQRNALAYPGGCDNCNRAALGARVRYAALANQVRP